MHSVSEETAIHLEEAITFEVFRISREKHHQTQIIACCEPVQNATCMASWLKIPNNRILRISSEDKIVPVDMLVKSYKKNHENPFLFSRSLNARVHELIQAYSDGAPTIIFCSSKTEAKQLAQILQNYGSYDPSVVESNLKDADLQNSVAYGVGYQDLDTHPDDVALQEHLFSQGNIWALVNTASMSHCSNLSAKLVLIKGTHRWGGSAKGFLEYRSWSVTSMLGKSGRPGKDRRGTSIIMTQEAMADRYSKIHDNPEKLKSNIGRRLASVLLDLMVQTPKLSEEELGEALQKTLLCTLLREEQSKQCTETLVRKCLDSLISLGLIDKLAGPRYAANNYGKMVSANYMDPYVMKHIEECLRASPQLKEGVFCLAWLLKQLAKICSLSDDNALKFRHGEKKPLENLWKKSWMKFHTPKRNMSNSEIKAYVLIQASIASELTGNKSLDKDMQAIYSFSLNVLSMMGALCVDRRNPALLSIMMLFLCLRQKSWVDDTFPVGQLSFLTNVQKNELRSIGVSYISKLATAGQELLVSNLTDYKPHIQSACKPLGLTVQRVMPFGGITTISLDLQNSSGQQETVEKITDSQQMTKFFTPVTTKTQPYWWTTVLDKRQNKVVDIRRHGSPCFFQVPAEENLIVSTIHENICKFVYSLWM